MFLAGMLSIYQVLLNSMDKNWGGGFEEKRDVFLKEKKRKEKGAESANGVPWFFFLFLFLFCQIPKPRFLSPQLYELRSTQSRWIRCERSIAGWLRENDGGATKVTALKEGQRRTTEVEKTRTRRG